MKKGIIAMFAATSIAAIAQAAITSSQVVGYQSIPVINGFNMIAFNFQPVDGSEDFAITNFISNKDGLIAGTAPADSDQIQVWDGSKFDIYFYRAYKATNPNKFLLGPAWVKTSAPAAKTADKIPSGKGFWYARPGTSEAGTLIETSPLAE